MSVKCCFTSPEIIGELNIDLHPFLKKSKEIVKSEIIIKGNSKNNLLVEQIIEDLSDKKIKNLSFEKYSEIFMYANKIGINHRISEENIKKIEDYKYVRNLFAHSDGTINQIFLNQVKGLKLKMNNQDIGKKMELSKMLLEEIRNLIISICFDFDNAILNSKIKNRSTYR